MIFSERYNRYSRFPCPLHKPIESQFKWQICGCTEQQQVQIWFPQKIQADSEHSQVPRIMLNLFELSAQWVCKHIQSPSELWINGCTGRQWVQCGFHKNTVMFQHHIGSPRGSLIVLIFNTANFQSNRVPCHAHTHDLIDREQVEICFCEKHRCLETSWRLLARYFNW